MATLLIAANTLGLAYILLLNEAFMSLGIKSVNSLVQQVSSALYASHFTIVSSAAGVCVAKASILVFNAVESAASNFSAIVLANILSLLYIGWFEQSSASETITIPSA